MKFVLSILLFLQPFNPLTDQLSDDFSEIEFITEDGINISASYKYPKSNDVGIPVIILIHQGGSSREEWLELPLVNQLVENGYAILAYDIRIHGKSAKDKGDLKNLFNNPDRATKDLIAAINYLKADKKIDDQRIGIIGASIGANLACVASSLDKFNVKSVVSMSAKVDAVQNLSGTNDSLVLKNAFFIASENEQGGLRKAWANDLYNKTIENKKIVIAKGNKHGSYILRENPSIENDIIKWFKKTL